MSASQMTTRNRISSWTAVFRPSLEMPKTASIAADARGSIGGLALEEEPAEQVPDREEDQDHHGDDHRDDRDHAQNRRRLVVHSVAPCAPAGRSRSAIRSIDPVARSA